jgi:hypothetical protein
MKLGYYKVRKDGDSYHFLRVWVKDGVKYYQVDHGLPEVANSEREQLYQEDYEVIKEYTQSNPISIKSPRVVIKFKEGETEHQMEARNWTTVERILRDFPRLAKELGFKE